MSEPTMTPAPADPYWTAEDLAKLVQVSEPTVYRWALDDPTMPTLRVGRTVRFPRDRVLRWLRDREQGRGRGAR